MRLSEHFENNLRETLVWNQLFLAMIHCADRKKLTKTFDLSKVRSLNLARLSLVIKHRVSLAINWCRDDARNENCIL